MSDITIAGSTSYPSSLDTRTTLQDGAISGSSMVSANINGPAAAILAIETELGTLPKGSAASVAARLNQSLNNDGTIKSNVIAGAQVSYSGGVFTISPSTGAGRLVFTNNTTVTFQRLNGAYVLINGVAQLIPSAGVTGSNGGLAASTLYYVYLYMNGATMTMEFSATGHTTDTTYGIEVKTGDATRTLIGMVKTNGSSAFQSGPLTLSFYNRREISQKTTYSVDRTSTSTVYGEINTEIQNAFLTWADEDVFASVDGTVTHSAADVIQSAVAFDGTTAEAGFETGVTFTSGTTTFPLQLNIAAFKSGLSEGSHYATIIGRIRTGATTGTWHSSTSATSSKIYLTVKVRG